MRFLHAFAFAIAHSVCSTQRFIGGEGESRRPQKQTSQQPMQTPFGSRSTWLPPFTSLRIRRSLDSNTDLLNARTSIHFDLRAVRVQIEGSWLPLKPIPKRVPGKEPKEKGKYP